MTEPSTAIVLAAETHLPEHAHRLADPRPYWVYLSGLGSAESRRTMQGCLDRIAAMLGVPDGPGCPWHLLRYEHTSMLRAKIAGQPGWSPSHVNKHLSALRGILKECWRLQLMTAEDYQRARDIREVKGHREPAGRNIAADEITAMLQACAADENAVLGARDTALLALLCSTGSRREEAANALIERYDAPERSLRVIGKGDKERTVYIHPVAAPAISSWLAIIDARRGPLLRPVDRWGNTYPRHMTPRAIGMAVNERRREAKLAPLSTHDFRRTFGGNFLDAGGDPVQLQRLFGHASLATVTVYDRRPGRALRAAVDEIELPHLNGKAS